MKKDIHPRYDFVVFRDSAADRDIITRSTRQSTATTEIQDGRPLPLIHVEISSASHPFFTGKEKIVDTAGRIERFKRKYENLNKRGS